MPETMLLAVPSLGQGGLEGERSGHFGRCDTFTLVELENGQVMSVWVIDNPPHEDGGCLRPVNLLASHNVNALVVAGMGARPLAGFRDAGIDVYFEDATPGIGDVVKLVLADECEQMDERFVCGGH
jgi:predicted Fe-Mo cluster-binding NifX family protein